MYTLRPCQMFVRGQEHQTNDVIAQSGKSHVTSLALVVAPPQRKESARRCHPMASARASDWHRQMQDASGAVSLRGHPFIQMHVMWLGC